MRRLHNDLCIPARTGLSAAGQHGSSGLGLSLSKNVDSGIGGICQDSYQTVKSWFCEIQPLTAPKRYSNPGFDECLHGAPDRPRLPEDIDNHPNCVFSLWIEIVLTIRTLNPTDR